MRKSPTKIDRKYEQNIINEYILNKLSSVDIKHKYGIHRSTVSSILKRNGVKARTVQKYKADFNFFDKIDTEEKAYWLGFLYADGCNTNNSLAIGLARKDKKHLEKFKQSIGSDHPIYDSLMKTKGKYREYSTIKIYSPYLCEQLKNVGCIERKSCKLRFPSIKIIPEHLIHHFMRGHFDGDGSLKRSKKQYCWDICGNFNYLIKYREILCKYSKLNKRILYKYKRKDYKKNLYSLSYGGRYVVLRIYDFLYKDATIFLDRKYSRFQQLLSDKLSKFRSVAEKYAVNGC